MADWLGNPAVRLLAPEIRGVLADLKCIANDGVPYGTLTHPSSGRPLTAEEIATITGTDVDLIRRAIAILQGDATGGGAMGVAGGGAQTATGGILIRLVGSGKLAVADMVHREEIRQRRASGGVKSLENPKVPRPKEPDLFDTLEGYPSRISGKGKEIVVSQNGSSSSLGGEGKSDEKGRLDYTPDFESAWVDYPKRAGTNSKVDAFKQWRARLAECESDDDRVKLAQAMQRGVNRYGAFCYATKKIGTETVMAAERFFGKGMHFLTPYEIPPDTTKPPAAAQMYANSEEALRNL